MLFFIKYGVGVGIVVHLHLTVDLHVFAAGCDVVEELVDGSGEIFALLQKYIEFGLTLLTMLGGGVAAGGLGCHVVNFECKDGEAVKRPRGRLCVYGSIGEYVNR